MPKSRSSIVALAPSIRILRPASYLWYSGTAAVQECVWECVWGGEFETLFPWDMMPARAVCSVQCAVCSVQCAVCSVHAGVQGGLR